MKHIVRQLMHERAELFGWLLSGQVIFCSSLQPNLGLRKGLVTDVPGPKGNACPGTLTPERTVCHPFLIANQTLTGWALRAGKARCGGRRRTAQPAAAGRRPPPKQAVAHSFVRALLGLKLPMDLSLMSLETQKRVPTKHTGTTATWAVKKFPVPLKQVAPRSRD